jgi:hypothetical protein
MQNTRKEIQMKLRLFTSILVLASAATPIFGQGSGGVDGAVVDESGLTLSGARVNCRLIQPRKPGSTKFELAGTPVSKGAVSTLTGTFSFRDLPAGRYTLCAYGTASYHLASCEWEGPLQTVQVEDGKIVTGARLTIRRGVAVNIVTKDTNARISAGRRFLPGIYTTKGFYKRAYLVGRSGDEVTYSLAAPTSAVASLIFDSDVEVQSETGTTLPNRRRSIALPLAQAAPGSTVTLRIALR